MSSNKTDIVIIDDEEDLCFLLSARLSAQGFNVSYFYTLAQGLAGIKSLKPEWVILDNNLPDGLGWEKAEEIKQYAPGVKIINISANPDSVRSASDPHTHYLIKPINAGAIVKLIRG